MASPELTKMSIENTPTATQPTASFDKQLADIKSQAAKIVTAAQKVDPNIKISTANAEMIGLPKVDIPTTKKTTPTPTELSRVGTTVIPKTSQDVAREAILSQVPEADRDTISQILDISTGYQTEKGRQLESTAESLMTQQLSNIQATRDRALESSKMKEAAMLPELEAELESIRGEADVLEARRNSAIQAESRRTGVSTSAMQGNIAAIDRDFNLDKANLAIRELASVGKINAATKLIDTKLDLKYGDLEAETALLTAQINAISPFLNREDQKAAETRLQLNEIVKTKIADARADDKALEEFKLQSYLFAQQNGATPATLSQIMSSTSREDVLSVGGSYVQDPMQALQMEAQRASIRSSNASAAASETRRLLDLVEAGDVNAAQKLGITLPDNTQPSSDLIAYAQQYAATGKIPTGMPKNISFGDVAEFAKDIPKATGTMVNINTGVSDTSLGQAEKDDMTRLYNITQMVEKLKSLDEQRIGGVVSGVFGKVTGSEAQAAYLAQRKAIVDEIARMQTGAALTNDEQAFYNDYLPGRFSEAFFIGQDSSAKIDNFSNIMNEKLQNALATNQLSIYGYSTVELGGQEYKVGSIITNEYGQQGIVQPDGNITLINQ